MIELTDALKRRNTLQDAHISALQGLAEAKALVRERREELDAAEKALREIEHELLTGESSVPLIEAGRRNGEARAGAGPDPPDDGEATLRKLRGPDAAREGFEAMEGARADSIRRGARKGGPSKEWRKIRIEHLLFDAGLFPSSRREILGALSEEEEVCINTVGDLADFLAAWRWGDLGLSRENEARLKRAVWSFRLQQGWDDATKWPEGIPIEWLLPEDPDDADAPEIRTNLDVDGEPMAAEQTPDGAAVPEHPCDLRGGRPWTDEDVDALLVHACRRYSAELGEWFAEATETGASDEEVYIALRRHWPHSRVFTGPDRTRRKHGYTLGQRGSELQFWVGAFKGSGHDPTLNKQPLLDAVRRVMGLPQRGESGPRAGYDLVASRPGSTPETNGVEAPGPPAGRASGAKRRARSRRKEGPIQ